MSESPQTDPIGAIRFPRDSNPTGIACQIMDRDTEYVVLAPNINALEQLMKRLTPKIVIERNMCKAATLCPKP